MGMTCTPCGSMSNSLSPAMATIACVCPVLALEHGFVEYTESIASLAMPTAADSTSTVVAGACVTTSNGWSGKYRFTAYTAGVLATRFADSSCIHETTRQFIPAMGISSCVAQYDGTGEVTMRIHAEVAEYGLRRRRLATRAVSVVVTKGSIGAHRRRLAATGAPTPSPTHNSRTSASDHKGSLHTLLNVIRRHATT